jgi:hypothetical protein
VRCANLEFELGQLWERESGRSWHRREPVAIWQRRGITQCALEDPLVNQGPLWVDMSGCSQRRVDSASRIRAYATALLVPSPDHANPFPSVGSYPTSKECV